MQVNSMAGNVATNAREEQRLDITVALVAAWVQPRFEPRLRRLSREASHSGGGGE
jgi:hypothetical protein